MSRSMKKKIVFLPYRVLERGESGGCGLLQKMVQSHVILMCSIFYGILPCKREDNKDAEEHVKGAGTILASSAIVGFSGTYDWKYGKILKALKMLTQEGIWREQPSRKEHMQYASIPRLTMQMKFQMVKKRNDRNRMNPAIVMEVPRTNAGQGRINDSKHA